MNRILLLLLFCACQAGAQLPPILRNIATTNAIPFRHVLTNGVLVGSVSNVDWVNGVTGYVSGASARLGVSTSGGAGEANVNGEKGVTNATTFGWVWGKEGISNLLRSFTPGWGMSGTNRGTNIDAAVDSAIIPSHTQLNTASNDNWTWTVAVSNLANTKQHGSAALTNLAGLSDNTYTNVPKGGTNINVRTVGGTNFIDTTGELNNWALYPTNVWNNRQGGSSLLTNWQGTGVLTNIVNGSTNWPAGQVGLLGPTNNGDVRVKSLSAGSGVTLTDQGTNISIAASGGPGGGWPAVDSLASNITFRSSATNNTNIVIEQRTGQLVPMLSVRGSNNAPIFEIDNRGFLILTNSLTNYNLGNTLGTPANTIALGVEDFGGFMVPAWFKDSKLNWAMNPARWNSRTYTLFPSAGTTVGADGVTTANAGGTTVAHTTPDEILPYMVSVSSAATSNSVGGVSMTVNLANAGAHNGSSKASGYFFHTEWCSTNIIGQVVGGGAPRYFIGLANAATPNLTNIVNTTNATGQYIGLMVDTRQSLNMFITCRDGSAEFRTNTGVNFKATNIFQLSLYNAPTNRFVGWRLKDLTDRLEAIGTFSNNVPTNFMKGTILAKNGTNRNNAIFFSKMYLQAPLTPQ